LHQATLERQNIKAAISYQTDKEIKIRKARNFILQSDSTIDDQTAFKIAELTWKYTTIRYPMINMDEMLKLMFAESRFRVDAISEDGALGLFQTMPINLRYACAIKNMTYTDNIYLDLDKYFELAFVLIEMHDSLYDGNDRWIAWNGGPRQVGKPLLKETKVLLANMEIASNILQQLEI